MTTDQTLLTLQDYAGLRDDDEATVSELVRGTVVREPRPGDVHGRVQVAFALALGTWAREHGASCTVESGYVLSDDPATVRGPDVAVVVEPRSATGQPGGWARGAPDLAVEVLSPSDASTAVHQKTLDYHEDGARLVWIVNPGARTVMVHRSDGSATLLREHQTLTGEDVLEGFICELGTVFEEGGRRLAGQCTWQVSAETNRRRNRFVSPRACGDPRGHRPPPPHRLSSGGVDPGGLR